VISCRYTNHDYENRAYRTYRLVIRERRMCYATEINCISPKIFGSCWIVRSNRTCMHILSSNICIQGMFWFSKDR
jgi:hypothetical protein